MSQGPTDNTSEPSPVAQVNMSLPVQEKIAARQAKRAAKAAERQQRSDALKEEVCLLSCFLQPVIPADNTQGNVFFRDGKYPDALDRYQKAIDVHGPSQKPILLANVAAAYLKLEMSVEFFLRVRSSHANECNVQVPRSTRGSRQSAHGGPYVHQSKVPSGYGAKAHGNVDRLTYWCVPFCTSTLASHQDAPQISWHFLFSILRTRLWKAKWCSCKKGYAIHSVGRKRIRTVGLTMRHLRWRMTRNSGNRSRSRVIASIQETAFPASFTTVANARMGMPVDSRMPQTRRVNGMHCECDSFQFCVTTVMKCLLRGRNVCRYYLMGVCKFGEQCSYLHSKEYLLQEGWWTTTEWISRERKKYDFVQKLNKAIADYNNQTKASGTGQTSKKQSKGKKKRGHRARPGASESKVVPAKNPSMGTQIGQSSQGVGKKSKKKPTGYAHSRWDGYGSGGDDENGMFGFTGSEVEELLCQGVKPWDDDAWVCSTRPMIHRLLIIPSVPRMSWMLSIAIADAAASHDKESTALSRKFASTFYIAFCARMMDENTYRLHKACLLCMDSAIHLLLSQ